MAPEVQMKGTYRSSSADCELHLGVVSTTSTASSTGGHGDISLGILLEGHLGGLRAVLRGEGQGALKEGPIHRWMR